MAPAANAGVAAAPLGGANPMIVDQARRFWAAEFRAAGIDSPELDARILVGHALSLDHAGLAAAGARKLAPGEASAIAALARRRLAHEPIARIVGSKEFWGLGLAVDAATLVPRPETETVVEAALTAVDRGRARPLRIADLGTGSGAILLALLSELPTAFGVGTDTNPAALAVARDNARRLGLTRAAYVACDMAAALARSIRPDRLQPALCRVGGYRSFAAGGAAVRSAPRARRRPRRSPFLSSACRRGACAPGGGRRARRRAWRRPGGIGRRFIRRGGACALGAATRS